MLSNQILNLIKEEQLKNINEFHSYYALIFIV